MLDGYSPSSHFIAELTPDLFTTKPPWDRSSPNPPLSANDAMVAADAFLKQLVAKKQFPDGAEIVSVELFPFDTNIGAWYWVVNFRMGGAGGLIPYIQVGVFMDGSVAKPKIFERTDLGWPLPDAPVPPKPEGIADMEITTEFVAGLNSHRLYAGQVVEITGKISDIETDNPFSITGKRSLLTLDDGTTLICDIPSGFVVVHDKPIQVLGQLVGFRDYQNRTASWDDLELFPGIRVRSLSK